MATNNIYELRIKIEDGAGGNSQIAGGGADSTSTSGATKATKDVGLGTFVATQAIKPFLQQTKNFLVNNVELMTGSTELQQRIDFDMQLLGDVGSVLSTTAGGATIGGPIGAGVGFIVGGLQVAMGYFFNQQQINLQAQIEDRQINYLTNRAGPAFNMSRRGN